MLFTVNQTIAAVALAVTMQSGIVTAIEPTRVTDAQVIRGDFESTVDKPSALKGAKSPEMIGPIYFDAQSVVDDPGNASVDPEAAGDDPTDQWADFYNRLYRLIAGSNFGDWSALLSNTPIASQPPANRAPVNTPRANNSPATAIPSPVVA